MSKWQEAICLGSYVPDGYASEGFIHFSQLDQVPGTASRYFWGVKDLVLLKVQQAKLDPEVRIEQAANGGWYPHLYGPLNTEAVETVYPMIEEEPGIFRIVME